MMKTVLCHSVHMWWTLVKLVTYYIDDTIHVWCNNTGGNLIAECLSMRHIILRGQRVPTVKYSVCIFYIFIYS